MRHRSYRIGICALALTGGLASAALAQSYPTNFAARCQPDQLRVAPTGQDPCAPEIAMFGLKGPTVAGRDGADVETTGSIRFQSDTARGTETGRPLR